jgi:hypothetical protein
MARPVRTFAPSGRPLAVWLLLAGSILAPGSSPATAAEQEVRAFDVVVDGKRAGEYHLTITRRDDGTLTVDARSDVQVKVLLVTAYSYSYLGQEVWKAGRLQQFACTGKENGKPFTISARADGAALRVRANGQEHAARPDVWTTSCWQLPAREFRNQVVPLLGCDSGKETAGRLDYVGSERINVAGTELSCAHYRVMKDVAHELWYDGAERLVRDEWVSGGHRTQVVLTALRR